MAKQPTRQERLTEILNKFHALYDDLDGLASEIEDSVSAQEATNLAHTERFQRLQEASEALTNARDEIDSALGDLDNVEF
jgi:peptidoglycan hydrolase CwlO-like protein